MPGLFLLQDCHLAKLVVLTLILTGTNNKIIYSSVTIYKLKTQKLSKVNLYQIKMYKDFKLKIKNSPIFFPAVDAKGARNAGNGHLLLQSDLNSNILTPVNASYSAIYL